MSNETGLQLAGASVDELMASAPDAAKQDAPAETPQAEKRKPGRPPGTGKNQRAAASAPPPVTQEPAAPPAPVLTQEDRERAALIRATLPHEVLATYMRFVEGYRGKAFDISDDEAELLTKKYLNLQSAIAALPPGNKRRLMTAVFGDGTSEGALVLAALAISAQVEVAGEHFDAARKEMAVAK